MTAREALQTLGVPVTATPSEARTAWLSLVRGLHSDFHQDKPEHERQQYENRLRDVNAAWEYLKDFFELPAAQRSRMLGLIPVEAEHTARPPVRVHPPRPPVGKHSTGRKRLPAWLIVSTALIPLLLAIYLIRQRQDLLNERAAAQVNAADATAPGDGDMSRWIGKRVMLVSCASKGACGGPECAPETMLHSLRTFYNIPHAFIVYGSLNRDATGLFFNEVLPGLRKDRFSVRPMVIVAETAANANRIIGSRKDPGNSCPFRLAGPITMSGYGGPLTPETRSEAREQEATLQLDELTAPDGENGSMTAQFEEPRTGARYHFQYGLRRDTIEGPAVPNAPRYPSDVGSLYRVKFRRVEYERDGMMFTANHEFIAVTRLSGEKESNDFRNRELLQIPRKGVRTLERIDMAGIRQCQVMVNDIPGYTACALQLIHRLHVAGRINNSMLQDLRFRFQNLNYAE